MARFDRKCIMAKVTSLVAVIVLQATASVFGAENGADLRPGNSRATLTVYVRQSKLIEPPWPVKRVSVTDPEIADVQVLTPRKVLVFGKAVGSTDLILWSEEEDSWQARIDVEVDLSRLKADLNRFFPGSTLELAQSQDVLVLTGVLGQAEQADRLHSFLGALELKYVDMTSVAGVQQVQIQVRVAEVSRTAIRAMGVNAFGTSRHFFGGSTIGSAAGGPLNPVSIGPAAGTIAGPNIPFTFNTAVNVSPGVTLFAGFPRADLEVFLQALAENQYLRILAEPNLVALSGEEATFLAGGEYPIPIVQGGTGGSTSISIEYREFGVRLMFRPTVLGDGRIRLHVAPEVSELSELGAVVIQGFQIPSVTTRKAETTLELKSGQTFAMAGLLSQAASGRSSRTPLLGDIPILGALFRSVRYTKGETELLVLVTASLVEPLSAATAPPVPGITHVDPNDWELFIEGNLQGRGPAKVSPADAEWLKRMGLDQLRGPGAWASYEQETTQSRARMESRAPTAPLEVGTEATSARPESGQKQTTE
ncbi:MAG: type II and III secretion system protein family protein [Phycisphaerae bacterium]